MTILKWEISCNISCAYLYISKEHARKKKIIDTLELLVFLLRFTMFGQIFANGDVHKCDRATFQMLRVLVFQKDWGDLYSN